MIVDFEDFRSIRMLVDPQKNIVIFPISRLDAPLEMANGTIADYAYLPCNYPIELKFPYSIEDLAEKIKLGIEEWNKHECYHDFSGQNTFEEKYYGVKGFKKAVQGNLYITLGWDTVFRKNVSLSIPTKRGYAYLGIDQTSLPDDADWIDFANAVMNYINMDLTTSGCNTGDGSLC